MTRALPELPGVSHSWVDAGGVRLHVAEALRAKDVPFAYLAFEGEQHGFRKAETIQRVYQAELWFYGRVLGFAPSDEIEPVKMGERVVHP